MSIQRETVDLIRQSITLGIPAAGEIAWRLTRRLGTDITQMVKFLTMSHDVRTLDPLKSKRHSLKLVAGIALNRDGSARIKECEIAGIVRIPFRKV